VFCFDWISTPSFFLFLTFPSTTLPEKYSRWLPTRHSCGWFKLARFFGLFVPPPFSWWVLCLKKSLIWTPDILLFHTFVTAAFGLTPSPLPLSFMISKSPQDLSPPFLICQKAPDLFRPFFWSSLSSLHSRPGLFQSFLFMNQGNCSMRPMLFLWHSSQPPTLFPPRDLTPIPPPRDIYVESSPH